MTLYRTSSTARIGGLAPDFSLPCTRVAGSTRQRARLEEYRGRWLVMVFYPRDFSLVCPTELTAMSARIDEFSRRGCEVLAISCDDIETHERWLSSPRGRGGLGGLAFPLASDEEGMAARAYGVFLEHMSVALRGLFLVDPNGVLQYQVVHNMSVGRRTDEVLRVLDALQTGGLCAENWQPEDGTVDPTRELVPGSVVAHYEIEERIGGGAFAAVYRALDKTLKRPVALKILRPGGGMTPTTVLAEARLAASLNHANICTVFSVDDGEGVPIIAMEYLAGRPLSKILRSERLTWDRAAAIGRQIAMGMAAAHARGIVHGDLKPENVMVLDDGWAKILDFGLSRRAEQYADPDETTVLGVADSGEGIYGTPGYMSPEQARGEPAVPASDVFALGVILFEMLTGRKAFPGDNILQVLYRIRAVEHEPLAAEVAEPYATILRRALVRDPAHRTIAMTEIADLLPR